MKFDELFLYQQKPAPFTPGEPLFWDDPAYFVANACRPSRSDE